MKTLQELKQFYDTHLLADLEVLEKKRKEVAQKMKKVGVVLACVAVAFFVLVNPHFGSQFFVIAVMLFVAIASAAYFLISREYVSEFKFSVIQRIIHFIDEDLNYSCDGYIPKSTFMQSQIFKKTPNRYKGDDLVSGKVGKTEIQFCELSAKHESGSGKNRRVVKIFKGLFFIGDFNKDFTCRVVVLPDTAEKLFGRIGQKLQAMNLSRDKLVKLEDPEFEKHFVVYSNDLVGARYILSTSLMKRIVDFKKRSNRDIHLSFIGSTVFVAISYTRSLFEPKIFRTLLDFQPIQEYFHDLSLAIGIVDDLNLNTRIWTKQ